MINWKDLTEEDVRLVGEIVDRANKLLGIRGGLLELTMDIEAAHLARPLRLKDLLEANRVDFAHDIRGIRKNIDRHTGEMKGGFLPRFSK